MTVEKMLDIVRTAEHNEAQLRGRLLEAIDECPEHPVVSLSKTDATSLINSLNDLLLMVIQTEVNK